MNQEANFKKIKFERQKKVGIITLSNGDMNLFDSEQVFEFRDAIVKVQNEPKIRALAIMASGEKAFSAGFDLKDAGKSEIFLDVGQEFIGRLYNLPIPKIALVHGYAIGIGCMVPFACDFRYCTKDAIFSLPEIKYKFMFPTHGGMTITSKIVKKPSDAKYILCTGEKIPVDIAEKMGIVDRIFDTKEEMIEEGLFFARKLAAFDPFVMSTILTVFDACKQAGIEEGMKIENEALEVVQARKAERNEKLKKLKEKYLDKKFL
ncbi:MAG: enoyl-CoA hydratase/isomerase family protein [Candidatus Helarchaeales archaeon]